MTPEEIQQLADFINEGDNTSMLLGFVISIVSVGFGYLISHFR